MALMDEPGRDWEGLPSIRQLRCFLLAAESGSIGRAAEEIGISQPAASHAVARLEAVLGVPLLVRHAGGSASTPAGELLALRVQRFMTRLEQGFLDADAESGAPRRILPFLRMVHLRAHIAIAETGTFTDAAERLGITGPALHRAARELEKILRKHLYRPGTNGIGVNALGETLARHMRLALHELTQARAELQRRSGGVSTHIAIGILPLMPKHWVAGAIGRLRTVHPEARVELREGGYSALLRDLRWGEVDLIVGALPPDEDADVTREPLLVDPYVLAVRNGHPLTRLPSLTGEILTQYDWVVPSYNLPRRVALERFFATLPRRPRIWLDTNSPGTMMAVLTETDCISIISRMQLLLDGPAGLSTLPVAVPDGGRTIGLTQRADWLPTQVERAFLRALRETAPPA